MEVKFPYKYRTGSGYMELPASGQGPGVLVLHAWWGLTKTFKGICNRLAEEGFTALAPDLFQGKTTADVDEAEALASGASDDNVYFTIIGAIQYLREHPACQGEKIGAVGFSYGGSWALSLDDPVGAIVTYYGGNAAESVTGNAPILGHFAEDDPFDSAEFIRELERQLREENHDVEFHFYPGTKHWFVEPNRPEYNAEAAELAWQRTVEFLRKHLGG